MGLSMKNFNILGVHWKIQLLGWGGGGGFTKKQYRDGGLPKKGGLGQFADLGVGWGLDKKEGGVFFCFFLEWGGGLIP